MKEKIIFFVLFAGVFTISSLVLQNISLKNGMDAAIYNYYQSNQ